MILNQLLILLLGGAHIITFISLNISEKWHSRAGLWVQQELNRVLPVKQRTRRLTKFTAGTGAGLWQARGELERATLKADSSTEEQWKDTCDELGASSYSDINWGSSLTFWPFYCLKKKKKNQRHLPQSHSRSIFLQVGVSIHISLLGQSRSSHVALSNDRGLSLDEGFHINNCLPLPLVYHKELHRWHHHLHMG